MPTPGGLPRVGERIRFRIVIAGKADPWRYGKVLKRTSGKPWSLLIRWDGSPSQSDQWLSEAGFYLERGMLEVVP